jgi:hypothetical protein
MGARTKEQIRNDIASRQAHVASMKAQMANSTDKNYKAYMRNAIALEQGRIAQLKADLKNAPK